MNRLEKAWLSHFLNDLAITDRKIAEHQRYHDELAEEIRRVETELILLRGKREQRIIDFANTAIDADIRKNGGGY